MRTFAFLLCICVIQIIGRKNLINDEGGVLESELVTHDNDMRNTKAVISLLRSTPCSDNELNVTIVVNTDEFPGENSWEIRHVVGDVNIVEGVGGNYTEAFTKHTNNICVPFGCHLFVMIDSYGDGLTNPGFYKLFVDDTPPVSGGNFAFREEIQFGSSCPSPLECSKNEKSFVKITINTDFYGRDTKWFLQDKNGLELTGGPYGPNQLYTFETCVSVGCLTFTITDTGNDGMCCHFGEGSYQLEWNGEVIKTGGDFNASETKSFGPFCTLSFVYPPPPPTLAPTFVSSHICPIKEKIDSNISGTLVKFKMGLTLSGSDIYNSTAKKDILNQLKNYAEEFCGVTDLDFSTVEIFNARLLSQSKESTGNAYGSYRAPPNLSLMRIDVRGNNNNRALNVYPKNVLIISNPPSKNPSTYSSKTPSASPSKNPSTYPSKTPSANPSKTPPSYPSKTPVFLMLLFSYYLC